MIVSIFRQTDIQIIADRKNWPIVCESVWQKSDISSLVDLLELTPSQKLNKQQSGPDSQRKNSY